MRRVLVAAVAVAAVVAVPTSATAAPPEGGPEIVILGDSYISGEAGRWAGNTNQSSLKTDALGGTAYWDTPTGEAIPGCHRSASAEVFIGGGVLGNNLACSGAKTSTVVGSEFKPGIDFYSDTSGRKGQALMLQELAATRNIDMVVLSIGGNDFGFASIVQTCVTNFLTSPSWWPNYCYDDSPVKANFTSTARATNTARIKQAVLNVNTAMTNAGYSPGDWTLLVQTYPSPIPPGTGFRYSQSGYTRQSTGGCGFWNRDADWANNTALPAINQAVRDGAAQSGLTNIQYLELTGTMSGRRLCEKGVGLLEERGISTWQSAGAVDNSEWIAQVRTVSAVFGPYQVQESIHPNYWGQLALRSCVRQAFNGGAVRGGTCTRTATGLSSLGEPVMTLQ
jgi:hypothetical protein